jgi:hypothetical protein
MAKDKAAWMAEMDQARAELWKAVDALDPEIDVCPGWNKRDFYAHIAGWEAIVYEVFVCNTTNTPLKTYPYNNLDNLDEANAAFVAERQSGTEDNIKLECEIDRYAIKRMMDDIPADDFDKPIQFPWGPLTAAQFARDAIKHERDHADDILKLQQALT